MFTISNIIADIDKGCARNNLNEECFSYRIMFFINEGGIGTKHYTDSTYEGLRKTLENIVRENISLTNSISIAQTTIQMNGRCVCLQSRSYSFNLDEYFQWITGKQKRRNAKHNRYATVIHI